MSLFEKKKPKSAEQSPAFYNTLSKELEVFSPCKAGHAGIYTCGPTVYDFAHIGNLRAYVFSDVLRRTLEYNGFEVTHIINLTDVGHLVSDGDVGEDKMAKAVAKSGLPMTLESMKQIADTYIAAFFEDIAALNILHPHVTPRPSEHIPLQIALIETLMQKEYAYNTSRGVYFDVARFKEYGKLGAIDLTGLQEGARVEEFSEKRGPLDFALWKKADIGWESPWGKGFPGWHIECSAMSMEYLGKTFDIHTGGIDHIPVHHNNEIAQSQAATGKPFVHIWMHGAFLNIDGKKIAKSAGSFITLRDVIDEGITPLAYRYWLLTAHYRSLVNFSWDALRAAEQALVRLKKFTTQELHDCDEGVADPNYLERFRSAINNDLDMPSALALTWELVKEEKVSKGAKKATLLQFDTILGLSLFDATTGIDAIEEIQLAELPEDIRLLVIAREEMREQKNWEKADALRDEIAQKGFVVEDNSEGPRVSKSTAKSVS